MSSNALAPIPFSATRMPNSEGVICSKHWNFSDTGINRMHVLVCSSIHTTQYVQTHTRVYAYNAVHVRTTIHVMTIFIRSQVYWNFTSATGRGQRSVVGGMCSALAMRACAGQIWWLCIRPGSLTCTDIKNTALNARTKRTHSTCTIPPLSLSCIKCVTQAMALAWVGSY